MEINKGIQLKTRAAYHQKLRMLQTDRLLSIEQIKRDYEEKAATLREKYFGKETPKQLVQVANLEPHCPNCGNSNAMLNNGLHYEKKFKCRDCGHEVASPVIHRCKDVVEAKKIAMLHNLAWN